MKQLPRAAGILLPVTALPSDFGIGSFGAPAYQFVDFLQKAGQSYWQILPIGPTGYGDSPYQSFSAFAGNPYLIDLQMLADGGLLTADELDSARTGSGSIRYDLLYQTRPALLRRAFARFDLSLPDYRSFVEQNADWLTEYCLFMAIKAQNGDVSWQEWPQPLRMAEPEALAAAREQLKDEIAYYQFVQYEFFLQWEALKRYANQKGISLIGDMPIYVAMDAAEPYFHPELFWFDEARRPMKIAGCPPDAFAADGQLWGNPLYRWERHRAEDYAFWLRRIRHAAKLFDMTRIDHFRGFESYYAIPADAQTAREGTWEPGPGAELFQRLEAAVPGAAIIAEDLGFLTPAVYALLDICGYPGMKVLQFAFDDHNPANPYLPHNYTRNCIVYTGTHDNDTARAYYDGAPGTTRRYINRYLHTDRDDAVKALIRAAYASVAQTAILPMADVLGLDSSGRINTPSTLGGNWVWQMPANAATPALAQELKDLCALYHRLPQIGGNTHDKI